MKKLLIIFGLSASMIASCNSGSKSEVADDTTEAGENASAAAQQSSMDTNVNKIGTDPAVTDSSAADSINKKQ